MLRKLFNSLLALIFIVLVILFAYKTVREPQILKVSLEKDSTINGTNNSGSFSKEELNAAIKEYILNNPDDIVKSVEGVQQQKVVESSQKTSEYLKEHKKDIEEADSPPILGNKNADISIVVFYDYNCSYCRQANEYTNELLASDPSVKIILRPIPILGGTSMYAAKAALAIQKIAGEKFDLIHNDLMSLSPIDESTVKTLVAKYDIDYALVENEVNSYSNKQLINKNFKLAKGLGIKGVPSYVVNGNFIPGLIPVDKFQSIILQIRNTAKAGVASEANK